MSTNCCRSDSSVKLTPPEVWEHLHHIPEDDAIRRLSQMLDAAEDGWDCRLGDHEARLARYRADELRRMRDLTPGPRKVLEL